MQRRLSFNRPQSTSSSRRTSSFTGSRKVSSAFNGGAVEGSSSASTVSTSTGLKKVSLIDDAQLEGKVKVLSTIDNSDLCLSVNYRHDGRYYAVALAGGVVNVYSSKTDNILYTLNNLDKNLPFTDTSATCVRFRPFHLQHLQSEESLPHTGPRKDSRRKSSISVGSSKSDSLFPPITPHLSKSLQHHPFSQRRRKSSVSALGVRPEELGLFPSTLDTSSTPNNLVTASFTDGFIKTFNFTTGECMQEAKENREILTIGYSTSGALLATGGSDGCIHLYDDETKTKTNSYRPPLEYKAELLRTYSIAFHPDSESELISGGWNKYIQLYDARVPNLLVENIAGPKICGEGLSFHPTGTEFCAASWGKMQGIQIYDYSMRRPIEAAVSTSDLTGSLPSSSKSSLLTLKNPQPMPSCLYSASYLTNNLIAFSGAHPGGLAIIERNSRKNAIAGILNLKKSVYCIDTFKSKIVFTADQEVFVSEVFL